LHRIGVEQLLEQPDMRALAMIARSRGPLACPIIAIGQPIAPPQSWPTMVKRSIPSASASWKISPTSLSAV